MSDSHTPETPSTPPTPPNWSAIQAKLFLVMLVGVGMFVGGMFLHMMLDKDGALFDEQFFLSYLVGFIFWLSLPIGSILLLCVQYLAGGRWGINFRRILEANTRTLPWLAILFVPIALNFFMTGKSIYWWANPLDTTDLPTRAVEEVEVRLHDYLNPNFALARVFLYFLCWGGMIYVLNLWSNRLEETGNYAYRERLKNFAGFGAMFFALITTFAATDWVMSLEQTWASTMFPVIFGVNTFLTCFAFCIIVCLSLSEGNHLPVKPTKQDQINMGSFMLAFTMFWSYTSFSQFLLVWAGNLPEEIPFYLKRSREGWIVMVWALATFHFACPFVILLFRAVKENSRSLRWVSFGILLICAVDVLWWITPSRSHDGQIMFWLMDIGAIVGIGGFWGTRFINQLSSKSLMPTMEAKWLEAGHHHG